MQTKEIKTRCLFVDSIKPFIVSLDLDYLVTLTGELC